ncbi:MAG: FMN-binding glutamate synthase family protein [Firmicutes bacterium]|nr:FMN-binding glutamate synthase family protein [Bacillota bacterium]
MNVLVFSACVGSLLGLIVLFGFLRLSLGRSEIFFELVGLWIRPFLKRLFSSTYAHNPAEMANVLRRSGMQRLVENELRAEGGSVVQRPMGSSRPLALLDEIAFDPAVLWRRPLAYDAKVETQLVLGPKAQKPLVLQIPLLLGAMGYGVAISKPAAIALAKGAEQAGTAVNGGLGPFLPEQRHACSRMIVQFGRTQWGQDLIAVRQASMVEIQVGHGAWAAAGHRMSTDNLSEQTRADLRAESARFIEVQAGFHDWPLPQALPELVAFLREQSGGVPIGIKLPASDDLEADLRWVVESGVDVVTIDGNTGATSGAPPLLSDTVGLPTIFALQRAAAFWETHHLRGRVTLITAGGLLTPEEALKAMALGAEGVVMGTGPLFALAHPQLSQLVPRFTPLELLWESGWRKENLQMDRAAEALAAFLLSSVDEMVIAMRALGKARIATLSRDDLIALTPQAATLLGLPPAWVTPTSSRAFSSTRQDAQESLDLSRLQAEMSQLEQQLPLLIARLEGQKDLL